MMNLDVSFTNVDDEDFHNLSEFCPNLYSLKMIGCVRITDGMAPYRLKILN